MRGVIPLTVACAVLFAACGSAASPFEEVKTGQTAAEARNEAPSRRPDWLPDNIPLPDDLVIFETRRMRLPGDSSVGYSLKGYTWQSLDAPAVTAGLREKLLAAGYRPEGNAGAVTPQLVQFSGNGLAEGTTAFLQVDSGGDYLILSLSINR
ncbi:hypothetical protein HY29_16960 [Hyphomonas beringensis]|uniref:Lipoprotein n=1 Tax=Hyphomonas beringensis TaxID=1280946 RepID=A0A062UAB5_9PROT|nr:hypothetical protein [Hyphomonas beringensis]KCZ53559.1 hypothetical protein HY29_16960 [Hyphomonas beringensis]